MKGGNLRIKITARHFDVTPALKSYLEKKLSRLDRYASDIIDVQVILQTEKKNALAEVHIKLKRFSITVKERNLDMYTAIDKVFDILKKQIIRHEERLKTHRHKKICT